ncbi:hypothetical protein M6B22_03130 [Jatrophihabitans cynanchi]|jgi:subtilase family serine protease|uniref:Uncharacterized protein n=1 Tax=Jatrophihabitans cynanchi TaxID=2944128 RepID=A0ABY7K2F7_9ACTN|nr:hypothetical protein [Jatrophihabitans sp. SB3-54]WAX57772.1 hypothetical protein M6B22_03130 [Jatrophihabitans sp. SB3-54]
MRLTVEARRAAGTHPYPQEDLQIFDSTFGPPDPQFEQIAPQGVPAFNIKDGHQVG